MIQLSKFLFYNTLVGSILILCTNIDFDQGIVTESGNFESFSMHFAFIIVTILFVTLLIKSILAIIYILIYKCSNKNQRSDHLYKDIKSHFWEKLDKIKGSIYEEIKLNL